VPNLERARPASALGADPGLAAVLADRILGLESAAASGGGKEREALATALDTWTILAAYPWVRLNYRHGCWESDGSWWASLLTFTIWENYHWVRTDSTFQMFDPHSGERIGEFWARPKGLLAMPAGTLMFAGDPETIGVYWPAGGDVDKITLGWSFVRGSGPLRDEKVEALRHGAERLPPAKEKIRLEINDWYRVWYVDSPEKPRQRAKNTLPARYYNQQRHD
jgi:hypothetical protein